MPQVSDDRAGTDRPIPPLDLCDTAILKAVGIIAIVLHNYFHLLPDAAVQNEFGFVGGRFARALLLAADPRQFVQASFSYFGHYGVQLFIFLSGYGLALRYWKAADRRGFLRSRIAKLYPTFALVLGLYFLLKLIQDGPGGLADFLGREGDELLLTALGVLTLVPGYGLPPVGPWWFLPFIMQLYLIWPGLAALARRYGPTGLFVLSALAIGQIMWNQSPFRINLLMLPIGHLPELALGIAWARFGGRVTPTIGAIAAVVFLLGNLIGPLWPLSATAVLLLMLWVYGWTAPMLRRSRLLRLVGEISMPMFFLNGYLRGLFWGIGRTNVWYFQLAGGLATLVTTAAVAYGIWLLERRLMARTPPVRAQPA
jgi:peptidoglycan/LPS O-acetylase OafA/YrhL